MLAPGTLEGHGAGVVDRAVGALVDRGGRVPADPGVVVDVVVLGEEPVAEGPGFGQRAEVVGEVVDVLQCLVVNMNAGGGEAMVLR